jgi:hypothetical protein
MKRPETQKQRVLDMPLKHVLSVIGRVNRPGTPKRWAIAHKTGNKRKNDEFWDMPLKHVVSVMALVNHLGNPKQWAIARKWP